MLGICDTDISPLHSSVDAGRRSGERLVTSLNWVCILYYVEAENVYCYIRCCKSIVFDITLSPRICVVTQGDSFGTRPKEMRISQRLFTRF